jgi:hypothetical protein
LLRPSLDFFAFSLSCWKAHVWTPPPPTPRWWIAEPCTHVMQYPGSLDLSHLFCAKASVPLFVRRRRCPWQLPRFCWKWAVLCTAQTHLTSCVYTAYLRQLLWLHDWKYRETTCVPKRVLKLLS